MNRHVIEVNSDAFEVNTHAFEVNIHFRYLSDVAILLNCPDS